MNAGQARQYLPNKVPEDLGTGPANWFALSLTVLAACSGIGTALAGVDRRQELALASLDAEGLDAGTARLVYLSSLVGAYIDTRYYQERRELTRQSITDNRRILEIVERERSIGTVAELDVAQAKAQLANVSAQLPTGGLHPHFSPQIRTSFRPLQ